MLNQHSNPSMQRIFLVEDSPIIREYGSRNQLSGGLGLSYTFNVKR